MFTAIESMASGGTTARRVLALDTATEACSVALAVDGRIFSRHEQAGRTHTARLAPMVQAVLTEVGVSVGELDALVCGIGPGSFAGVRIGVAYAKGLALALDLPVLGIGSLEMLAAPHLASGAQGVVTAIDARMGEVYFAAYARDAEGAVQTVVAPCVRPPAEVPALPAGEWMAVGTGWNAYAQSLPAACGIAPLRIDGDALPNAADALRLALPRLASGQGVDAGLLTPVYLRDKVALTAAEQAARRAGQSAVSPAR